MLTVRRFQAIDHDAVWDLHNLALHQVQAHAGNGAWDADLHQVETVYLNARGEFLVGTDAGKIVAMGALKYLADDVAEVKRMRVHPAYQRRGYGSAILKELEKRAVSLGYRMLRLDTTVRQTGAQRFYEKHGYQAVGVGTLAGFSVIYYQKVLPNTGVTPTHMC